MWLYQIAQLVAGADTSFDTLKEIADWIMSDQTGAAKMANDIQANAEAIADLDTLVGTKGTDGQDSTGLVKQIEDLEAINSNIITNEQIDDMISGLI